MTRIEIKRRCPGALAKNFNHYDNGPENLYIYMCMYVFMYV